MNHLTDDAPLIEAGLESPITLPTPDTEVTDLLDTNIIDSHIARSGKTGGWFSRVTRLSYEAWLNRGGLNASVE